MTSTNASKTQINTESDLTIGDVIAFHTKAKWFALIGLVIGVLGAISYLVTTPKVYTSKVTIQILPSGNNSNISLVTVSTEELIERLNFSQTSIQIARILKEPIKGELYDGVVATLKSASISKGGNFLILTSKANSPDGAEELSQRVADAVIIFITQLNSPRINYLEKLVAINNQLITSNINNPRIDIATLRSNNLALEALLASPEGLKPLIVDGPSFSSVAISPKYNFILLLGTLLGLGLGLILFYIRDIFFKQ